MEGKFCPEVAGNGLPFYQSQPWCMDPWGNQTRWTQVLQNIADLCGWYSFSPSLASAYNGPDTTTLLLNGWFYWATKMLSWCNISLFQLPDGSQAWSASARDYVKTAVYNIEEVLSQDPIPSKLHNQVNCPLQLSYHPEIDVSPLLDPHLVTHFQTGLGVWCWIVELGHIDILTEASMLSATTHYLAKDTLKLSTTFFHTSKGMIFKSCVWSCIPHYQWESVSPSWLDRFLSQFIWWVATSYAWTLWLASRNHLFCQCWSCW